MTTPVDDASCFTGAIGFARRDITPPVPIASKNWGAARHVLFEGVHRPLTAAAMAVVPAEGPSLVMVAIDLCVWTVDDWSKVVSAVHEATGIRPPQLMVSLSHTHSSPALTAEVGGRAYIDLLAEAVAAVAAEALASAQPATLSWSSASCALGRHRDYWDAAGSRYVCGFNPEGAQDDTVLVGRVVSADGRLLGVVVNYACHGTTLAWDNRQLSPDFTGAMREVVEDAGDDVVCLFIQGTSGDIAPRRQYTSNTDVADANGRHLGFATRSALEGMLPAGTRLTYAGAVESGATLGVWELEPAEAATTATAAEVVLRLPVKPETSQDLDASAGSRADDIRAERARRQQRIRSQLGADGLMEVTITAWRLGDALILASPAEAYTWMQVELRERFRGRPVVVANLTNGGYVGYLPQCPLYAEPTIYQVWVTPLEEGSLEVVADGLAALGQSLLDARPTDEETR